MLKKKANGSEMKPEYRIRLMMYILHAPYAPSDFFGIDGALRCSLVGLYQFSAPCS